ncbi:MAG TPA: amidohydrolase family protein [Acidimicrobiales bacterium]|nr:amidohydrolase family protein [Acidimicrobiales bacterium]
MAKPDFGMFDADNHYYEATDAFTRHVAKDMQKRCMQWAELAGKTRLLVGGEINTFIPNPTFDPIAKPGSLQAFFKGQDKSGQDLKALFGELEPIRPEYRDRDARLAVMDAQGVDACWMFPTLGVGMEEALKHDPPAIVAAFRGFNQWLDEDWGYAYRDRIFAAPYLSLVDLPEAIRELELVLARGARFICLRPAPVDTPAGCRSPFLEEFDPFWAQVAEAGITVALHGGDSGAARMVRVWEPETNYRAFFATPLQRVIQGNRAITDCMAAALCHRVFDRHPRLRFASIENGASWVVGLVKKVDKAAKQTPGWFRERPSETFRRHVWVSPFWEDNAARAIEAIGVERTLFGSDWPHTEGMVEPADYLDELATLPADAIRQVMRDNCGELTRPLAG